MNTKRNQYIVISALLLAVSALGMILTMVFGNQMSINGANILAVMVVGTCSLVFVATLLTLLLTRGGQKSFGDAFKGLEKRCLTGALIVTSAIILTSGCLSLSHYGHHSMRGDRQMMYQQKGYHQRGNHSQFFDQNQGLPNQNQQGQPTTPDQNQNVNPDTNQSQNTTPDTNQSSQPQQSDNSSQSSKQSN